MPCVLDFLNQSLQFIYWTPKNQQDRNPLPCSTLRYRSFQGIPQNSYQCFLGSSFQFFHVECLLLQLGWPPVHLNIRRLSLSLSFRLGLNGYDNLHKCSIRYTVCWRQNKDNIFLNIESFCMYNIQSHIFTFEL